MPDPFLVQVQQSNVWYTVCRPEILKQEIKVFFVKYNDPIYVKLEKLDIMIRLASQANIAQVQYRALNTAAQDLCYEHNFDIEVCSL